MDPVRHLVGIAPNEFDTTATATDSSVVLTFATDFDFAKRLVRILGPSSIQPEGRREIHGWFSLMIDSADKILETALSDDAKTPEIAALRKEVDEARIWVADLLGQEL